MCRKMSLKIHIDGIKIAKRVLKRQGKEEQVHRVKTKYDRKRNNKKVKPHLIDEVNE